MEPDVELEHAYAEILSAVSHDLRNPLGTLAIAASALGMAAGSDPLDARVAKLRTIAERVQRQTDRLGRIVDGLADFAAIRGGRLVVVPMRYGPDEVLEAAVLAARAAVDERGLPVIAAATAPGLPAFTCDLARVRQVATALAGIAARVAPKASAIVVGVIADRAGTALTLECELPELDEAAITALFAATWRSPSNAYKAAGLPLALVRGIVAGHGGTARAEPTSPGRARFVITFSP